MNQNATGRLVKWMVVGFALFCCYISPGYGYLKAKGKIIVDSNDREVLLRGIGLGGWIVPEGYQLHVPGFGSPTSIRTLITDLIGAENTAEFYRRYESNYVTEGDIEKIASWGFNSIRLPFCYYLLTPKDQPSVYLEEGFAVIDTLLQWCQKNELYLILDMHCAPGGQNKDNISDADGIEARLWTEPANQTRTVDIWKKIAERYASEEWIGGYDLINEPVLPSGHTNVELRQLYMRITQAIREVDTNHIIFIEGNWYATDFNSLTPPFDANLVYSFHRYWCENTHATIQNFITIRNTYKVPLWLGESGENSNTWFYDAIRLLEDNKIGWCWWTHKKVATLTSPYSSPITSNYQVILDYWNKLRDEPGLEFSKNALFEMAENLKTEYCEFRPDVLKALMDKEFGVKPKPYTAHVIPGIVNCSDFDFGRQDIAYHDSDFQNARGLTSGDEWNRGDEYRNDGVDLQFSNDSEGAMYSIGWIETSEWMKYTVDVRESGKYNILIRVASPNSTGRLQLLRNDQPLTSIVTVPNTGGWFNWQTLTIEDIQMSVGTTTLTLYVYQSGFNVNSMRFVLVSSSNGNNFLDTVPTRLTLNQNYPNPFNSSTNFWYGLPNDAHVRIDIFNSLGQLISSVEDGEKSTGWHLANWSIQEDNAFASDISSGVYFYQIESTSKSQTHYSTKKMLYLK